MRMTPRLLATATVGFVSVAQVNVKSLTKAAVFVHGVPASVSSPAHHDPSTSRTFPCESLHSTAFMPTV